jgi:hypothetical protein
MPEKPLAAEVAADVGDLVWVELSVAQLDAVVASHISSSLGSLLTISEVAIWQGIPSRQPSWASKSYERNIQYHKEIR